MGREREGRGGGAVRRQGKGEGWMKRKMGEGGNGKFEKWRAFNHPGARLEMP